MNTKRRKRLTKVCQYLDFASDELSDIIDDEHESIANTPDSLQDTDAFVEREACLDSLLDAMDDIRYARDVIRDAASNSS